MLEVLTGTGLAAAAGLNAYIPLLLLGLGARFFDFLQLPGGWTWLENEWVLGILGVLLVIQTVVRPASGGIVFGGGAASETAAVTDPAAFFSSNQWVPIVSGVVIALLVHGAKTAVRPALNMATFGLAAPVASSVEDAGSVLLSLFAVVVPVLVVVALVALVAVFVMLLRRRRRVDAATASGA
jgi:hypothetical protein